MEKGTFFLISSCFLPILWGFFQGVLLLECIGKTRENPQVFHSSRKSTSFPIDSKIHRRKSSGNGCFFRALFSRNFEWSRRMVSIKMMINKTDQQIREEAKRKNEEEEVSKKSIKTRLVFRCLRGVFSTITRARAGSYDARWKHTKNWSFLLLTSSSKPLAKRGNPRAWTLEPQQQPTSPPATSVSPWSRPRRSCHLHRNTAKIIIPPSLRWESKLFPSSRQLFPTIHFVCFFHRTWKFTFLRGRTIKYYTDFASFILCTTFQVQCLVTYLFLLEFFQKLWLNDDDKSAEAAAVVVVAEWRWVQTSLYSQPRVCWAMLMVGWSIDWVFLCVWKGRGKRGDAYKKQLCNIKSRQFELDQHQINIALPTRASCQQQQMISRASFYHRLASPLVEKLVASSSIGECVFVCCRASSFCWGFNEVSAKKNRVRRRRQESTS